MSTQQKGHAIIAEIRERYPNPIKPPEKAIDRVDRYSVGGALCLIVEQPWATAEAVLIEIEFRFPPRVWVANALRILNPHLTHNEALARGSNIVDANDKGEFEWAWWEAETALNWRAA